MAPDANDLLGAWERVLRELRDAAGAGTGEVTKAVGGVLQRQGELLQDVLERQARLEQELRRRALAPVDAAVDLLDQTAGAMRAQATALDAAATAFKQASEMLDLQASLLERTVQTVRDPVGTIWTAGGAVVRRPRPDEAGPQP